MGWDDIGEIGDQIYNDITGQPQLSQNEHSKNGFLQQTWNFVTSAIDSGVQLGSNPAANDRFKRNAAIFATGKDPDAANPLTDPAKPATSQPTLGQATTSAIQQQVRNVGQAHSASSILTGGAGLLDQPTTQNRVLVGA